MTPKRVVIVYQAVRDVRCKLTRGYDYSATGIKTDGLALAIELAMAELIFPLESLRN